MPKIKQTKMRLELDLKKPWVETIVYVNYENTTGRSGYRTAPKERFYVNLPQIVADALSIKEVRGADQEAAMEAFKEAIKQFKNLKMERTKVILYRFGAGPLPKDHPKYEKYKYTSHNYKAEVWAGTYEEVVAIAGDGARRYSYEHIESDIYFPGTEYASVTDRNGSRFDCQVPWTEQNERFFLWIQEQMEKLVLALVGIGEPEQLVDAINAGRLLPLGSE